MHQNEFLFKKTNDNAKNVFVVCVLVVLVAIQSVIPFASKNINEYTVRIRGEGFTHSYLPNKNRLTSAYFSI